MTNPPNTDTEVYPTFGVKTPAVSMSTGTQLSLAHLTLESDFTNFTNQVDEKNIGLKKRKRQVLEESENLMTSYKPLKNTMKKPSKTISFESCEAVDTLHIRKIFW